MELSEKVIREERFYPVDHRSLPMLVGSQPREKVLNLLAVKIVLDTILIPWFRLYDIP
jgi:hypothetical protein